MAKLKVVNVNENNEYVFEKNNHIISLCMEFYGIDGLKKGDEITILDTLLDTSSPNFVQPYAYEVCDFDEFEKLDLSEKIAITSGSKILFLKRIYG